MKTIILIISILSLSVSFAGNGKDKLKSFTINGSVKDNVENLTGVKVILDGRKIVVYTDFEGNFTIDNVLEGEHSLSFNLITYNSKEVIINPKNDNNLTIQLETK